LLNFCLSGAARQFDFAPGGSSAEQIIVKGRAQLSDASDRKDSEWIADQRTRARP
jgi:hypothetical protein